MGGVPFTLSQPTRRVWLTYSFDSNPAFVEMRKDFPGKSKHAAIEYFSVEATTSYMYYQLHFGDLVYPMGYGVIGDAVSLPARVSPVSAAAQILVPIKFRNDDLPARFRVALYQPYTEVCSDSNLVSLGVNGHFVVMISFDYEPEDWIPNSDVRS